MSVHLTGDSKSEDFSKFFLTLGDRKLKEKEDRIEVPTNLYLLVSDAVFTKCDRIIMTSKYDAAKELNNLLLQRFECSQKTNKSVDAVVEVEDTVDYSVEFLNTLNSPEMVPHSLNLKIKAPVMLLRNFKPPKFCNGTEVRITILHTLLKPL